MARGGKREGAGRKRGSLNTIKAAVEESLAAMNCDPIAGLARIARDTERKNPQVAAFCYAKLANKLHADKKAHEHSGADGGPIAITVEYVETPLLS